MSTTHATKRLTRRQASVAVLAIVAAIAAAALPSPAQAATAKCTFEADIELSVPVGMNATRGRFESDHGKTTCTGDIGHATIHGNGSFSISGNYGSGEFLARDSCLIGIAASYIQADVPQVLSFFGNPIVQLRGHLNYSRLALVSTVNGFGSAEGEDVDYRGTARFEPDPGQDCVVTPLRSGRLVHELVVTSDGKGGDQEGNPGAGDDRGDEGKQNCKGKKGKKKKKCLRKQND